MLLLSNSQIIITTHRNHNKNIFIKLRTIASIVNLKETSTSLVVDSYLFIR